MDNKVSPSLNARKKAKVATDKADELDELSDSHFEDIGSINSYAMSQMSSQMSPSKSPLKSPRISPRKTMEVAPKQR
jgi:hypothetical protein